MMTFGELVLYVLIFHVSAISSISMFSGNFLKGTSPTLMRYLAGMPHLIGLVSAMVAAAVFYGAGDIYPVGYGVFAAVLFLSIDLTLIYRSLRRTWEE
jgi:hypothetical protein